MAPKMYLLVEPEQSSCDPLSKWMTQFVDQLQCANSSPCVQKICPTPCVQQICPAPCDEVFTVNNHRRAAISAEASVDPYGHTNARILVCSDKQCEETPVCGQTICPSPCVQKICPSPCVQKICPTPCVQNICPAPCDEVCSVNNHRRAAISGEASVDPYGHAKAKILALSDKQCEQTPVCPVTPLCCPKPKMRFACIEEPTPCCRRNGLDPTFSEIHGRKKFEYLPMKSKIPEYGGTGKRCAKPIYLADPASSHGSSCGINYRSMKLTPPVIQSMRETCARNIPEARLVKYGACISRNNGLQDKCDPLARRIPVKQRGNCNKKVTRARPKRLYVRKTAEELDVLGPKKVPSRELRGGVLYTDCDCNRRNGLQHDCPRDRCAGDHKCLAEPWPTCELSRYYRDKFAKHDKLRNRPPNPPRCVPFSNDFARKYVDAKNKNKS